MNRAMIAAASGMSIEEANLQQISENVSHAEDPGYKSSDLWASALSSGLGASVGGTRINLSQGKLQKSGGPFDLAISGNGFFKVNSPNGDVAYSRLGDFQRNAAGQMVNGQGCTLAGLSVPADATSLTVNPQGEVLATVGTKKEVPVGQIDLAVFPAADRLRQGGVKGVYFETAESGIPKMERPGADNKISFGMLEKSNISIVESMLGLLAAQRAYEADSKGVQAADEMLRIANNLQRS